MVEAFLSYVSKSVTAYHTVEASKELLLKAGFKEIELEEEWSLGEGDYFVNVYGTTLFAFHIGKNPRESLHIASAHTDFPGIRVKPHPYLVKEGYGQVNIETYGGLILSTWLDRPLSLAGAITLKGDSPYKPKVVLVDAKRPIGTIPNLAIHMNRTMNEGVALNRQKDMLPMIGDDKNRGDVEKDSYWRHLLSKEFHLPEEDILSYELSFYVAEEASTIGFDKDYVQSPRLDNLTSCYGALQGMIEAKNKGVSGLRMTALFDNEEVGSRTKQGGAGLILPNLVHRIYKALGFTDEAFYADVSRGFMVSADVAHAYHPNHGEKNDLTNIPVLNGGLVLKVAASQSYAGDAVAQGIVTDLCNRHHIDHQIYVNRSDIPGGSTVGSISSANMAMRTMDIGLPLLAMHSARELMGAKDIESLIAFMSAFLGGAHA